MRTLPPAFRMQGLAKAWLLTNDAAQGHHSKYDNLKGPYTTTILELSELSMTFQPELPL